MFGYRTEGQLARKKPMRCALEHIVHENGYRRMGADELRQMLARDRDASSYDEWIKAFCDRKYNCDFAREMTRSVAEYLKDFEA